MSNLARWLTLPARAPMLLVLALISFYLGAHWGFLQDDIRSSVHSSSYIDEAYWLLSLSQVVIVVSFCTLPELVLRQISLFMAASKVITLVVTLLLVVVGGMYLLYMPGFGDLLVLTAALLLARLDLVRLKVWPPAWLGLIGFNVFILIFMHYGHAMHLELLNWPWFHFLAGGSASSV